MRTSLRALAIGVLFFGSFATSPAEDAAPKTPDGKVGTRLKFQAYDGDPTKPGTMSFQINTLDLRQPSEFLKIGDVIGKTPYKLTKFVAKKVKNPKTGEDDDVSELTITDASTHQEVVLVLDKLTTVR